MAAIADNTVDLVVTSPPYPMIAMWDHIFAAQSGPAAEALAAENGPAAFEAMHRCLDAVWTELFRVLSDGGFACINIGDAVRTFGGAFALYPNHARILSAAGQLGFTVLPTILWRKPTNAPSKFMGSGMMPPNAYVTLEHEHILILRKGRKRVLSLDADRQRRRASAYFWEERNAWFSDVWIDLRGTDQANDSGQTRERSGAFPQELPFRLISMFSIQGDTVLDPFAGLGTTMAAAAATGRHSIGYEIDSALAGAIRSKMAAAMKTANQRTARRIDAHRRFADERRRQGKPCKHFNAIHRFPVMTGQETDLCLVPVTAVRQIGADTFEAEYAKAPPVAWVDATQPATDVGKSAPQHPRSRQSKLFR